MFLFQSNLCAFLNWPALPSKRKRFCSTSKVWPRWQRSAPFPRHHHSAAGWATHHATGRRPGTPGARGRQRDHEDRGPGPTATVTIQGNVQWRKNAVAHGSCDTCPMWPIAWFTGVQKLGSTVSIETLKRLTTCVLIWCFMLSFEAGSSLLHTSDLTWWLVEMILVHWTLRHHCYKGGFDSLTSFDLILFWS